MSGSTFSAGSIHDPEFKNYMLNQVYLACVEGTAAATQIPSKMLNFWNQSISRQGWATIGPRKLTVGDTHYGDLRAPTERKFISADPYGHTPTVKIELEEEGGKARVTLNICTVSMFNEYKLEHSVELNDTDAERETTRQEFRRDINDARGKYLIVYLNAHGSSNRHFKYELTPMSVY
jgi:hypothetical protein